MNDGEMTTTRLAGVGHYKYNNQHKNDDNVARQKLAQQYALDGTTGQNNTRLEQHNSTVRLTSIYNQVSGNQNLCFTPTETIDGQVSK